MLLLKFNPSTTVTTVANGSHWPRWTTLAMPTGRASFAARFAVGSLFLLWCHLMLCRAVGMATDLNLAGDSLVPVLFFKRLYLLVVDASQSHERGENVERKRLWRQKATNADREPAHETRFEVEFILWWREPVCQAEASWTQVVLHRSTKLRTDCWCSIHAEQKSNAASSLLKSYVK